MPQAGLLELVAHGIQDIFLIGNPQITFFKTVYKRHTNFSMEAYQISYDKFPKWGDKTTFKIDRYADLIYTAILEIDYPQLISTYTSDPTWGGPATDFSEGQGTISWVNNTGHASVLYYDLKIGGQLIDRQYSEWMDIWTQLTQNEAKKRGLDLMLNRYASLVSNPGPLTTYTPFQFWFNRNIGLALPLIALQYHDVEIEVNFRPFKQMYSFGANNYYYATSDGSNVLNIVKQYPNSTPNLNSTYQGYIIVFPDGNEYYINPTNIGITIGESGTTLNPYTVNMVRNIPVGYTNSLVYIKPNGIPDPTYNFNMTDLRLYIDYIYLDTIEQKEFATKKHRYLIEQLQFSGAESVPINTPNKRMKLNFNLPVKELYWVNQLDNVFLTNDLFNYSNTVNPVVSPDNIMTSGLLYINGIERFSIRSGNYFRLIQPYQKHTRSPNGFVYSYAFSVNPEEHQPSGCSNFSKIDTKELYQNYAPGTGTQQLRVYALNYNVLRIFSGMGGVSFSS